LLEGQHVEGQLGPDQAVRALREAQWNAALVQRPIGEFSDLLLPVVLLLKTGDAVILLARRAQASGPPLRTVLLPGQPTPEPRLHAPPPPSPSWRLNTRAWRWWPRHARRSLRAPRSQCRRRCCAARPRQPLAVGHDASLHPVLPLGPAGGLAQQQPDAGDRPGHLGHL
jgi:hypothetical protein